MFKNILGSAVKLGTQAVLAAASSMERLANRQEFDAVVAACVLVASADGSTSTEEKTAAIAAATAHPALKSFPASEVAQAFTDMHTVLGFDRDLGVQSLYEKVAKVTNLEARARIASIATAIANADGNLSASESAVIARIRSGA